MVLQKRLDYGFNGYQVPPTPRAARSIRRQCLFRRKADDHLMHGFDLLATVAGKLLSDGESSLSYVDMSSDKEKPAVVKDHVVTGEKNEDKLLEEKSCDQDCYERKFQITELVSEAPHSKFCSKEINCAQNDAVSRPALGTTASDCSDKNGFKEQLVNDDCKLQLGFFTPRKDVESCGYRVSNCGSLDGRSKQKKIDSANSRNLSTNNSADISSLGLLEAWSRKPHRLVSSVDSVNFPFCQDCIPCGSFSVNRDNVNLVTRDDDNNSSRCTEPSTSNRTFRPPQCVGDRKFRKLRPSNHCKVISNVKDDEHYNVEKCNKHDRTNSFKQLSSLRDYPFKRRKLYGYSLASNPRQGTNGDRICSLPENGSNGGALSSSPMLPGVTSILTSAAGEHGSFHSSNPQVKLKIKSFRVPELIIEIPETATVGSLKKTVMEALTTVLGGGLCVGVLLQGKKIRDDNKTLMQTGISHDDKTDTLGFTLEPSPSQLPMQICQEDCPRKLLQSTPRPLASSSVARNAGRQQNLDPALYFPGCKLNNFMESNNDSLPPPPDISSEKTVSESKVLVPAPAMKQESLTVRPMQKFKRSDSTQRRIRRPFTISEVEALVQAVEKLGTGRWRDVKLRAFDSAKYRTYVDLKDKWKTLVHTAQISPQQRRGEPVPQELLDRVLTAHAYWSQQQAKQQFKPHPDTCLLL